MALLLGVWFVVWAAAIWAYRPWKNAGPSHLSTQYSVLSTQYLWWLSVPMFAVFLAASLKTSGQLNWPVTAYLSGGVLAAAWLDQTVRNPRPWVRRSARFSAAACCPRGRLDAFRPLPG